MRDRQEYQRAYYHEHKERKKASVTNARSLRNYGLTTEQVLGMFDKAGDKCQCCSSPVSRPLSGAAAHEVGNVDHDHVTGEVRGILCNKCNQALGLLGDRPDLAVAYLEGAR